MQPCSHPRYGLTDRSKGTSGELLRLMIVRGRSTVTVVRRRGGAPSSASRSSSQSPSASRSGKLKPLAITGVKRHPLVPEVPTLEELGYKGFDGVQWYGIVGPANLPAPIVKTLNDEINKALAAPDLKERLSGEALDPMPMTPEQFGRYIREDIAKWTQLAKARNIEIE